SGQRSYRILEPVSERRSATSKARSTKNRRRKRRRKTRKKKKNRRSDRPKVRETGCTPRFDLQSDIDIPTPLRTLRKLDLDQPAPPAQQAHGRNQSHGSGNGTG